MPLGWVSGESTGEEIMCKVNIPEGATHVKDNAFYKMRASGVDFYINGKWVVSPLERGELKRDMVVGRVFTPQEAQEVCQCMDSADKRKSCKRTEIRRAVEDVADNKALKCECGEVWDE